MVDLSRSKLNRPMGTVIRKTDIRCDYCGQANFVVEEPGSETPRWLRCPLCDQYYYVIFGHVCVNVIKFGSPMLILETIERELKG